MSELDFLEVGAGESSLTEKMNPLKRPEKKKKKCASTQGYQG